MRTWTTTEARRRLRDVLDAATEAPQRISRDGRGQSLVLLSETAFQNLSRNGSRSGSDLVSLIRASPLMDPAFDGAFDLPRPRGPLRDVEL